MVVIANVLDVAVEIDNMRAKASLLGEGGRRQCSIISNSGKIGSNDPT